MSDYSTEVYLLRGELARMLAQNDEQFIYVLTEALSDIDDEEIIELGNLSENADPQGCVNTFRRLADAIERGEVS
ncbi:MAG: hypothetical protein AAGI09_02795 [Pseudomonadota bacterium]